MKGIMLNTSEQMLLALLRSSLHEREPETNFFHNVTEEDWKQCYNLAIAQGVMALAWDGLLRLPEEYQPIRRVKLPWAMAVERYVAKYLRYCKTVVELSAFYANHGIEMVQLKGVGFSTLYPVPSHREGGDIDIYTYSADKSCMSDHEANQLADKLMAEQGLKIDFHSYKHSNFNFKGVPVENHKCFLDVKEFKEAIIANEILVKEFKPVSVELPEGQVQIPSPTFNSFFIVFHALQHYGRGIALHHLCDWAIILKNYGWLIPEEMKSDRFLNAVKAMTHICNEYLGTDVHVEGGKELVHEMIQEILDPTFKVEIPPMSKLNILIYKVRRLRHYIELKSHVFDISVRWRIWDSIVSHICRPNTIFERKHK